MNSATPTINYGINLFGWQPFSPPEDLGGYTESITARQAADVYTAAPKDSSTYIEARRLINRGPDNLDNIRTLLASNPPQRLTYGLAVLNQLDRQKFTLGNNSNLSLKDLIGRAQRLNLTKQADIATFNQIKQRVIAQVNIVNGLGNSSAQEFLTVLQSTDDQVVKNAIASLKSPREFLYLAAASEIRVENFTRGVPKVSDLPNRQQLYTQRLNEQSRLASRILDKSSGNTVGELRQALQDAGNGNNPITVPPSALDGLNILETAQNFKFEITGANGATLNLDLKSLPDLFSHAQAGDDSAIKALDDFRTALAAELTKVHGSSSTVQSFANVLISDDLNAAKSALTSLDNPRNFLRLSWMANSFDEFAEATAAVTTARAYKGNLNPFLSFLEGNIALNAAIHNSSNVNWGSLVAATAEDATFGQFRNALWSTSKSAGRIGVQSFGETLWGTPIRAIESLGKTTIQSVWKRALIGTPIGMAALAGLSFIPGVGTNIVDAVTNTPGFGDSLRSGRIDQIGGSVLKMGAIGGVMGGLSAIFKAPAVKWLGGLISKAAGSGVLSKIPFIAKLGLAGATGPVGLATFAFSALAMLVAPKIVEGAWGGLTAMMGKGNDVNPNPPSANIAQNPVQQAPGTPAAPALDPDIQAQLNNVLSGLA
ncbi:MAG: hypothetical protein SFU25_02910 [Candidatus Caenarcaniphilales bacterium]|nr:hypothetical protein [Candidatus Caenarcaniphilales bacterium]